MAPLMEIDPADWDLTFAVNVRAMLVTTQVSGQSDDPERPRHDHQHGQHGWQGRRPQPGSLRGVEGRR
jgi:NAD(P)-dependent dehydrogenase (short-subunit alcohol dehydrogenase family)